MTKTQSDRSTKIESEFFQLVERLTRSAQEGLKQEIAAHKAKGNPIFYSWEGIFIMELPDGRRFEYKLDESGTEQIIRPLF
jgi:hypothetical protein